MWTICGTICVHITQFAHSSHLQKFSPVDSTPPKQQFSSYNPIKNSIFSCNHCSCSIFLLISYSLDAQVMLILILIDVQYSQKAVFGFEKGLNCQNHSTSGSLHLVKKSPHPSKISDSPPIVSSPPGIGGGMIFVSSARQGGNC